MGTYIDPPSGSKEVWLEANAIRIPEPPKNFDSMSGYLPVCLVDNFGIFTAAAIAFSQNELLRFSGGDPRPRKWFLAPINKLLQVSPLKHHLSEDADEY